MIKIQETICAFLNTDGGHLIFGIDDSTREIFPICIDKSVDSFILRIDAIIHSKIIVTSDGKNLLPQNIKCSTVKLNKNSGLIFITVTPTPNTKYSTNDGAEWYRLSASNYRFSKGQELFTQQQLKLEVQKRASQLTSAFQSENNILQNKISDLKKDYTNILGAAKNNEKQLKIIKKDMECMKSMLHEIILKQKNEAEMRIEQEKKSWWSCLFP